MDSIKGIRGLLNRRSYWVSVGAGIVLAVAFASGAAAGTCLAPPRPFVPSDPEAAREYADLIRQDFELYIRDIQSYFLCLEAERARAFEEAREVLENCDFFSELPWEDDAFFYPVTDFEQQWLDAVELQPWMAGLHTREIEIV